jgi:hypothetical protein
MYVERYMVFTFLEGESYGIDFQRRRGAAMIDIIYDIEMIVTVMVGVMLLLWVGMTQSELTRREREPSRPPASWDPDQPATRL